MTNQLLYRLTSFSRIMIILALMVSGCTTSKTKPTQGTSSLTIIQPANGEQFRVGTEVQVKSKIDIPEGTKNIILMVNGQAIRNDQLAEAIPSGNLLQAWTPDKGGKFTLQNQAVSMRGSVIESNIVTVMVIEDTPTPSPITSTATLTQTAEMVTETATLTTTPTMTLTETPSISPTDSPTQTATTPIASATQDANCRSGPGTIYPIISGLRKGQFSQVVGRNTDNSWWVINRIDGGGGTCWIANITVAVTGNFSQVPVVAAPPTPRVVSTATTLPSPSPTITLTFTLAPPTATATTMPTSGPIQFITPTATTAIPQIATSTATMTTSILTAPSPISPTGTVSCSTSVRLSWTAVSGAVYYLWTISGAGSDSGSSSNNWWDVTGLVCGQTYTWKVQAVDAQGREGPYSNEVQFKIQN